MGSFRKATMAKQPKLPPASRISHHKAQLLISTGIPSLDDVLGGGLPVGSILLVKEDRQSEYSRTLLSYFLSQGIAAKHKVLAASAEGDIDSTILSKLPHWVCQNSSSVDSKNVPSASRGEPKSKDNDLKIAWRYKNLPGVESSASQLHQTPKKQGSETEECPFCHTFDLSTRIPRSVIEESDIVTVTASDLESQSQGDVEISPYDALFRKISSQVEDGFSTLAPPTMGKDRNILRIGIRSLGSSFWQGGNANDILRFFLSLKGLLRYSFAACVVTVPAHLYQEHFSNSSGLVSHVVRRIEHICDAVVELESFEGQYIGPKDAAALPQRAVSVANNYHGFFRVHKLPCLNTLVPPASRLSILVSNAGSGSTSDLAFCLRRKKFTIETYHLPIEGGVTDRRIPDQAKDQSPSGKPGCSQSKPNPLDF